VCKRHIFNKWNLQLPAILPTNVNDWINEFFAIYNTEKIISYLETDKANINTSILSNPNLKRDWFGLIYILNM
jgi:hypothetical protein